VTGIDLLLLASEGGGSGAGTIGATDWANIFSVGFGFNPAVTLAASGVVDLGATVSPTTGNLYSDHNGVVARYTGPLMCDNGDTLSWGVQNTGTLPVSGSVTVANSGAAISTFTFIVKSSSV
jgi:hypothetical protein